MKKFLLCVGLCRIQSHLSLSLTIKPPYKYVTQRNCYDDKNSYFFLDCGNLKRLEKFGSILVSRSCPAAKWKPFLAENSWESSNKLIYEGDSGVVHCQRHICL